MSLQRAMADMLFLTVKTSLCGSGTCVKCAAIQSLKAWNMMHIDWTNLIIGAVLTCAVGSGKVLINQHRYPHYPRPKYDAHPQDCSVMTYRGHSVLRTLIRCHFSPGETTGGQYLYSGSADGRIHVSCPLI